ncbi:MAG: ABC transporter substrate-binding protein [Nitrospirae bacterium]|nr:MAG: ABC transporter substrate-binding protein [Nitrospirota bacterium]
MPVTLSIKSARHALRGVLWGAAAALFLAGGAPATAAETPTEAVRSTVNEVIRLLSDEELKQPAQSEKRRKLVEEAVGQRFDYEELAKRSLAAQWTKLSQAERQEFVDLFKSLLSNTYGDKIEGYAGEQVHYLKERLEGAYAEVQTKVSSNKTDMPLDYRLLNKSGDWRVYDVVVDGVSLVKNYRGQFERIIKTESYAALVEKLRKKSSDIKAPRSKAKGS